MQVSIENTSGLERKLTIQVPGEDLQKKIDARLREIGQQVKIKGFRPGRIPFKVIQQRYGKSVKQEIIAQAVQSSLAEAIEKEKLRPASSPVLESAPELPSGGDLTYTASIEIYPEVGEIDITAIELQRPDCEISEADVDDMLQTLREQRQTWTDVEGKPQEGHQALIEYVAETDEGRVPEEGSQRLALIMGTTGFDKLEKAVSTLERGGEKKVKLTFPEDYGYPELAGKKASVEVKLVNVQERHLPEIDEDFIRSFSIESGDVDELKREVKANLERELKQATNSYLKSQLVSRLLELKSELEVPEGVVKEEAANMARSLAARSGAQPNLENLDPFLEKARKRVRSGLLLGELANQNQILIDGARVRKAIETVAETYEQPREVVQLYYSDQRLLKAVENAVLEEQVVDWAMEEAKVDSVQMGFKDVINAAAAAGQS